MKTTRLLLCLALAASGCGKKETVSDEEIPGLPGTASTQETPEPAPADTREPSQRLQAALQHFQSTEEPDERGRITHEFVDLVSGGVPAASVVPALGKLLQTEPDKSVKRELLDRISEIDDSGVVPQITVALAPEQPKELRLAAIDLLENYGDKRAIPALQKCAADADPDVAKKAANAVSLLTETPAPQE